MGETVDHCLCGLAWANPRRQFIGYRLQAVKIRLKGKIDANFIIVVTNDNYLCR